MQRRAQNGVHARSVRRGARRFWCFVCLCVGGLMLVLNWPAIRSAKVFGIRQFDLVDCPEPGRPAMRQLLIPYLRRSIFDTPRIELELAGKLQNVPEVKRLSFKRRWPNQVDVHVVGREPVACAKVATSWVSVDVDGDGIRNYTAPPSCLLAISGVPVVPTEVKDKVKVSADQLKLVCGVGQAIATTLGLKAMSAEIGDGGSLRVRLTNGDQLNLGQIDQIPAKLQVYRAVRRTMRHPVAYVDVSDPNTPVVQAVLPTPQPAPAPEASTPAAQPEPENAPPAAASQPAPTKPGAAKPPAAPAKPPTTTKKPASPAKPPTTTKKPATPAKPPTTIKKPATPAKPPTKSTKPPAAGRSGSSGKTAKGDATRR